MTCGSSARGSWLPGYCCSSRARSLRCVPTNGCIALHPEEIWALPLPLPMFAYLVRGSVGDGPFPLVIMNHGVSMSPTGRSFFPLVESRDAAKWFARQGYFVVAPVGTGYGAAAIDLPEHGLYGPFFSKVGKCSNPTSRPRPGGGRTRGSRSSTHMIAEKRIVPKDVIVVGQPAGGWAAIALSSLNPPQVKAIITFAAGRGGRVDNKPNNNCAPDKLVEAAGDPVATSRVLMLWIYIENDTSLRPCPVQTHARSLYRGRWQGRISCGAAVWQRRPFLRRRSPDAIPIWSPLVTQVS